MSQTITLKYPVTDGGITVSDVKIRRPKVRDMIASDGAALSDAEKEVRLFANLCDLPPTVVEELDVFDYQQIQKAYTSFLD